MQYIINTLSERDLLKKQLELDRESGKIQESLEGFEAVAEWDLQNKNDRGYVDVLGHIGICLKLLLDKIEDKDLRKALSYKILENASQGVEKAKELALPKGSIAIAQVHQAQAFLSNAEYNSKEAQVAQLNMALETIDEALVDFPGTEAAKAWPLNAKAQIQYKSGDLEGSMNTILKGHIALFNGYHDQLKEDNNSDLKIKIWLTGLYLTAAKISKDTGRKHICEYYANAVLSLPDESNHLANRKLQAKELLKA